MHLSGPILAAVAILYRAPLPYTCVLSPRHTATERN